MRKDDLLYNRQRRTDGAFSRRGRQQMSSVRPRTVLSAAPLLASDGGVDKNRRNFLKLMLIGGGTLIVGKIFGPLFSRFSDDSSAKNDSAAFRVIEDKKNLSVYDDSGKEVLQIDKTG